MIPFVIKETGLVGLFRYRYRTREEGYQLDRLRSLKTTLRPGINPVIDRIVRCGELNPGTRSQSPRPMRCHHPFCFDCRLHRQRQQEQKLLKVFENTPRESIFWVTVLLDLRPGPLVALSVPPSIHTSDHDARTDLARYRQQEKKRWTRSPFRDVRQMGFFEFANSPYREGHRQRDIFMQAWEAQRIASGAKNSLPYHDPSVDLSLRFSPVDVCHLHAVVSAKIDGRYVRREELVNYYKTKYRLPYQVLIKGLNPRQSKERALANLARYQTKFEMKYTDTSLLNHLEFFARTKTTGLKFDVCMGARSQNRKDTERKA